MGGKLSYNEVLPGGPHWVISTQVPCSPHLSTSQLGLGGPSSPPHNVDTGVSFWRGSPRLKDEVRNVVFAASC
jgi:hypothetical protein